MKWFTVFAVAIIVEGLTEYLKEVFPKINGAVTYAVTAVIGVMLCVTYGADIFATAGLATSVPYIGCAFTGVLVSRGSSYIHQLMKRITTISEKLEKSLDIDDEQTIVENKEDEGVM